MTSERTMDGLAAARARGRIGGRPAVITADKLAAARLMRQQKRPMQAIAKALGLSRTTLYRHRPASHRGRPRTHGVAIMADGLLMALAGAWDAIRAGHQDVPPVVLVVGSDSRPTAKRRTFAHFNPTGWRPPAPSDSGRLSAGLNAIDEAIESGDHEALSSALAASAQATWLAAAQVSREAEQTLSEVMVTEEDLARGPAEVQETPAARGCPWQRVSPRDQ